MATRSIQTNSIERSTVLLILLARVGAEAGSLGLVDVGTSGGGNLLFDRWTTWTTSSPCLPTCPPGLDDDDTTVLGWYRWHGGRRSIAHVATAHAPGRWIRWWDDAVTA